MTVRRMNFLHSDARGGGWEQRKPLRCKGSGMELLRRAPLLPLRVGRELSPRLGGRALSRDVC